MQPVLWDAALAIDQSALHPEGLGFQLARW